MCRCRRSAGVGVEGGGDAVVGGPDFFGQAGELVEVGLSEAHFLAPAGGVVGEQGVAGFGGEFGAGEVEFFGGVGDGADQGFAVAGAAAEDDAVDGDALGVLEVGGDVGDLGQGGGEPAVRVCPRRGVTLGAFGDGLAFPVQPAVHR